MSWIELNIHWILIVTGALTSTIVAMVFAPRFAFNLLFGETPLEPSVALVVRSFAALVFGGGLLVIYTAFDEAARPPVLLFIALGKLFFAGLVVAQGKRLRKRLAMQVAIGDIVFAGLYLWYLAASHAL